MAADRAARSKSAPDITGVAVVRAKQGRRRVSRSPVTGFRGSVRVARIARGQAAWQA